MEASHHRLVQSKPVYCSSTPVSHQKRSSVVVSVLSQPVMMPSTTAPETTSRYNDNWFDRFAIHHLSRSVQAATGMGNDKSGFESLVEAASAVSRNYDPTQQQQLVSLALHKAFPQPFMSLVRMLVPECKFTRELFAAFTTLFFAWLVGPCEVRESEINGAREKNVVYIKKCRFLEETNCVGMCTNLCKIPSQGFIKGSLGMPVTMVPNFEDMSCEMVFGEEPPALKDDPALIQPCYKLCKAARKKHINCSI